MGMYSVMIASRLNDVDNWFTEYCGYYYIRLTWCGDSSRKILLDLLRSSRFLTFLLCCLHLGGSVCGWNLLWSLYGFIEISVYFARLGLLSTVRMIWLGYYRMSVNRWLRLVWGSMDVGHWLWDWVNLFVSRWGVHTRRGGFVDWWVRAWGRTRSLSAS